MQLQQLLLLNGLTIHNLRPGVGSSLTRNCMQLIALFFSWKNEGGEYNKSKNANVWYGILY